MVDKQANILVFGGSGFLGDHLLQRLDEFGYVNKYDPPRTSLDLMELSHRGYTIDKYEEQYDFIFLCTNWFRPGNFNVSADEFVNNNVMNNHVLWYWKNQQPQATLVTFGSDAAYDENEEPIESNYLVGSPNPSYYSYGLTKRFLYQGVQEIHKQTGSPYLHFPLISIFGQYFKKNDEHLMHAIVKKIVHAKYDNQPAVFWGDGSQYREVSFVNDVVENIIEFAMFQEAKNDILNLGSNKRHTVKELVQCVCNILDYDIKNVIFDAEKSVGIGSKRLNSDKARSMFPEYHDTLLYECAESSVEYYIEHKDVL